MQEPPRFLTTLATLKVLVDGAPACVALTEPTGRAQSGSTAPPRAERAVARSLAETADPRDAPAGALKAIGESLGWRLGALWQPEDGRMDALRCVETWTAPGAAAGDFEALSRSIALAPGEGLPGRVWRVPSRRGSSIWWPIATSYARRRPAVRVCARRSAFRSAPRAACSV